MTSKERTSREWFAVSTEGMRQLHAGRPPWSLVKELVQNVWDESPPATRCEVQVRPAEGNGRSTEVEVLDDGPGFANIADVYTLMGTSAKQGNPSKRCQGRRRGENCRPGVAGWHSAPCVSPLAGPLESGAGHRFGWGLATGALPRQLTLRRQQVAQPQQQCQAFHVLRQSPVTHP